MARIAINTNITAVAVYVLTSQDTNGSGIPDFIELFYYGSTTNSPSSDTDEDGFDFAAELARGYDPTIPDITASGGGVLRLSDTITYVPSSLQYYYQIQSQPGGIPPLTTAITGYASSNAMIQTPDIAYGQTSSYYFTGWTVNGMPQVGVTGASLASVTLEMTNDQNATANYVLPSLTAGGLPNWWLLYWFGNTNETTNSDPTGDGFTLGQDLARGYCPVVANTTTSGGGILRLSDATTYVPVPLPCCDTVTISISGGEIELAWTAGGVLQSASSPGGSWSDVSNATDPYFITATEEQMFYRVRFPN